MKMPAVLDVCGCHTNKGQVKLSSPHLWLKKNMCINEHKHYDTTRPLLIYLIIKIELNIYITNVSMDTAPIIKELLIQNLVDS